LYNHNDGEWAFHERAQTILQTQIILDSFERLLDTPLIPRLGNAQADAKALYEAPFAVLSHGIEPDPILNYGNMTALSLWETSLDRLLSTPSRLTAEPMVREARETLMNEVLHTGFMRNYSGVRIAATGRRFRIENVTIWNLSLPDGSFAGQAATFDTWSDL
jgi:hypothetical protein